jgi:multiple sugar transport system substrate-binding protein
MKLTRRSFLATTTASLAMPAIARAQGAPVDLSIQFVSPGVNKDLFAEISRQFMAKHQNVNIVVRAPEEEYEGLLQNNLRAAITRSLPDIAFHGLNRQRTLLERDIPVDLAPFLKADAETDSLGYSDNLLSLGRIGGKQIGIGFELSTPVFYYNLDLVRKAGGDPHALPKTWDELIKLAAAIDALGGDVRGLFFDWTITGNWSWQSLVLSHGGTMTTPDESRVAFGDAPGRAAIAVLRSMVDDGRMPNLRPETARSDFITGRLGIIMQSTAQLGRYNREIGGRFPLKCGRFPLASSSARLPAGGNAAMMFTRDAARQKLAWEFIKLATGPVGATLMVNATGYFPGTTIPATREDMLAKFYRDNPNHLVGVSQQDVITGWYAFPGQNALKITDVINDGLQTVVSRERTAEAAMDAIMTDVQSLLPRQRS